MIFPAEALIDGEMKKGDINMVKDEKIRRISAIILCCIFALLIAALVIYDREKEKKNALVYENVMLDHQKKQEEKAESDRLKEEKRQEALGNFDVAVSTYLNGIVFYGDSLTEGEGGNGVSYPSILYSLVRNGVCDTNTAFVNVLDPVESAEYATYFPIVFIGTDSGWDGNILSLIEQQKRYIGDRERYIVIGIPTGTGAERASLEAAMAAEYGDRYINIREYMSTEGLYSLELEIRPEDSIAMERGSVPPSLMSSDMLHLNDNGYKLVAFLTFDRMTTLGYFDEINQAAQYMEEAGTAVN